MNSSLASSKRFVVSEADYSLLESLGTAEYLIEFRLKAYQASALLRRLTVPPGLHPTGLRSPGPCFG